jgi:glycosyltransferase involved in cell wall biosynthesis
MLTRKKRILWVSNHTPFLTDFGGGQRSNLIYRALRSIGQVDVLLLCPQHSPGRTVEQTHGKPEGLMEIVEPLRRGELLPWRYLRPFAPSLIDKIAYNLGQRKVDYDRDPKVGAVLDRMLKEHHYDLIVGRHLKYPSKSGALNYMPTIIDVDDNELEAYRLIIEDQSTTFLRRTVLRQRIKSLKTIVPELMAHGTYLWVSKEDDRHIPGCERAAVLPNIPYAMALSNPPAPLPPAPGSKTILFVGMLSYLYNAQGITTFLAEAWPLIRQAQPDAVFRLVGSRLSEHDRQRWSLVPGVEVFGYVEDLRNAYRDCAFVVVPIWSGGGTNIKVLEALMYGRTCVLAYPAYRGYSNILRENESLMVGRDSWEIAMHCIELLQKPQRCAALAGRGAAAVTRAFSYDKFTKIVLDTANQALCKNGGVKMRLP